MDRHLIVVEGFACPNDPESYVVGGFVPLVGSPMANRSWGRDQTKSGPKTPMENKTNGAQLPLPGRGSPPPLEPGLEWGQGGERLVARPSPMGWMRLTSKNPAQCPFNYTTVSFNRVI